jgi:hypothetical protein
MIAKNDLNRRIVNVLNLDVLVPSHHLGRHRADSPLARRPRHSTISRPRSERHSHLAVDQPRALHILITERHLADRIDISTSRTRLLYQCLELVTKHRILSGPLVKQHRELMHALRTVRGVLHTLERHRADLIIRARKALPHSTSQTPKYTLTILDSYVLRSI